MRPNQVGAPPPSSTAFGVGRFPAASSLASSLNSWQHLQQVRRPHDEGESSSILPFIKSACCGTTIGGRPGLHRSIGVITSDFNSVEFLGLGLQQYLDSVLGRVVVLR